MRAFCLVLGAAMMWASTGFAGDVAGKIYFKGAAPPRARIMMDADPRCMAQHKEPAYSQDVVVNANGTLRNVLVSVKSGLPNRKYDPPKTRAVLDQKGCQYIPHVLGIMVGQELEVTNDDPTLHNVHSLSKANPQFNVAQPRQGMQMTKRFDQPETFKVRCEVHPWMGAYIAVLNNPFFAVTGDDGAFVIKNLPPGEYTIEAWHERYGTRTASVKVGSSGTASADLTFETK